MATKKKAAKKHASKKKVVKPPVEILIGADGSVPAATHISKATSGGTHWKSADRKLQWEVYFLCDPFAEAIVTSPVTGKTRTLHLSKKVADGDQFNYHVEGPLHPRKNQVKTSSLGGITIDA